MPQLRGSLYRRLRRGLPWLRYGLGTSGVDGIGRCTLSPWLKAFSRSGCDSFTRQRCWSACEEVAGEVLRLVLSVAVDGDEPLAFSVNS